MGQAMNNSEHYRAFCETVRETVMQRMGEDFEVTLHPVVKNNNVKLDSLIIRKHNAVVMPSIYLNSFFDEFCKGKEMEDIIKEILQLYDEHHEQCQEDISFAFEDIKQHIFFRLVNKPRNKELLDTLPHIDLGDLAITFHFLVFNGGKRMGTVRISWEHCAIWETSFTELMELAATNTSKLVEPTLRSMESVIEDILWDSVRSCPSDELKGNPEEQIDEILNLLLHRKEHDGVPMHVLSNTVSNHGASSLLAIPFLDRFREELGEDFFILPSSIHEAILVPQSKAPDRERLCEMVTEINGTQVPEQEYLSDNVYLYSEFRALLPEKLLSMIQ